MTTTLATAPHASSDQHDRQTVAALDLAYQAAVKRHDVATMDAILHDDFAMVLGDGRLVTRDELMAESRAAAIAFEQQDEVEGTQAVRVWGDTAVVTARLWVKGMGPNGAFDRKVWFSDTYVRCDGGWRYAFAQVSLPN